MRRRVRAAVSVIVLALLAQVVPVPGVALEAAHAHGELKEHAPTTRVRQQGERAAEEDALAKSRELLEGLELEEVGPVGPGGPEPEAFVWECGTEPVAGSPGLGDVLDTVDEAKFATTSSLSTNTSAATLDDSPKSLADSPKTETFSGGSWWRPAETSAPTSEKSTDTVDHLRSGSQSLSNGTLSLQSDSSSLTLTDSTSSVSDWFESSDDNTLGGTTTEPEPPPSAGELFLDADRTHVYQYVQITDVITEAPPSEIATAPDFEGRGGAPTAPPVGDEGGEQITRNHSRVRADVVLTDVGPTTDDGRWIHVDIGGACSQAWSRSLDVTTESLAERASDIAPVGAPDQHEDVSAEFAGAFWFERRTDGTVGEIVHSESEPDGSLLMFREGVVNSLTVDVTAVDAGGNVTETDRTTVVANTYSEGVVDGRNVVSRTGAVEDLGLSRRADFDFADDRLVRVRGRDELALEATSQPSLGEDESGDAGHEVPWTDATWPEPVGDSAHSPINAFVLTATNIGLVGTAPKRAGIDAEAQAAIAGATIRNVLSPSVAEAQVALIAQEKAQSRWEDGIELLSSVADADNETRDALRNATLHLLVQAITGDSSFAAQAESAVTLGQANYTSQMMIAALATASGNNDAAQAALARVIESPSVDDDLARGAMLNALSVEDPSQALVEATLARANFETEHGESAMMLAGALAGNTTDARVADDVTDLLTDYLAGDTRHAEVAAIGLTNLGSARALAAVDRWQNAVGGDSPAAAKPSETVPKPPETRNGSRASNDKIAIRQVAMQECADPLQSMECWVAANCMELDDECYERLEHVCVFDVMLPGVEDPPFGWSICLEFVFEPDEGSGSGTSTGDCGCGFLPAEPGDYVWPLVIGPAYAQGHFWIAVRPGGGQNSRLAKLSADTGLEFRSNGTTKRLFYGEAAFSVDRTDSDASNNLDIAGMTVGQIQRKLSLTAAWKGETFLSRSTEFPCGIGASGQLFDDVSHTESTSGGTPAEEIGIAGLNATKGKLLPELVFGGPAVNASVPVMGIVSLQFGVGLSARVEGYWQWSLDMCDFGISQDVLGTAAAEVGVQGSVDVSANVGLQAVLVEAGIALQAKIFAVEAPLRGSLQLLNDAGTLKIQPCYSFSITPSVLDVVISAYARLFIKIFGRKIVLAKWEGELFRFNMGQELELGGSSGSWEVFASPDCAPVAPAPPIIVDPVTAEGPTSLNGLFKNPVLTNPAGLTLPVGSLTAGGWNAPDGTADYRTGLQKVVDAFCGFVGLSPTEGPPIVRSFESTPGGGGTTIDSFFTTSEYFTDSETGLGAGNWVEQPSGSVVEEVQCGDVPTDNDTGVITIDAYIETSTGSHDADTSTPDAIRLDDGGSYYATFTVTNTGAVPVELATARSDGLVAECGTGLPLTIAASGGQVTCETQFTAFVDPYGAYFNNAAGGVADAVISHTFAVTFVDDQLPAEAHGWYHGINPDSFDHSVTAILEVDAEGDGGGEATAFSPGPFLGDGGTFETEISIQATEPINSVQLQPPFDALTCVIGSSSRSRSCIGSVEFLPSATSGVARQTDVQVILDDGTGNPGETIDHTVNYYLSFTEPPALTITNAKLDASWMSAYPGASPFPDESPATAELRFLVRNDSPVPITNLAVTFTIDNSSTVVNDCTATSPQTWECVNDAWNVPQTGTILEGSAVATASWDSGTETTASPTATFWVDAPDVPQPIYCQGNGGLGLSCSLPNLTEILFLDEVYAVDVTYWRRPGGGFPGANYPEGNRSSVVAQIVNRPLFDQIWTEVDPSPDAMRAVLNQLEEEQAIELLIVNGWRVAPEQQIVDMANGITVNYNNAPDQVGFDLANQGVGGIGVSDDVVPDEPVWMSDLFTEFSPGIYEAETPDTRTLYIDLPYTTDAADLVDYPQTDVITYWDLVVWINFHLHRLAQQEALHEFIIGYFNTGVGPLLVQMDEPLDYDSFPNISNYNSNHEFMNSLHGVALGRALDTPRVYRAGIDHPSFTSEQSDERLMAMCPPLFGCNSEPLHSITPTIGLGYGSSILDPTAIESGWPGDGARTMWYYGCASFCEQFMVTSVDILDNDLLYQEGWFQPGISQSDEVRVMLRQAPGSNFSLAGLSAQLEVTTAVAQAIQDGEVSVIHFQGRFVDLSEAEVVDFFTEMAAAWNFAGVPSLEYNMMVEEYSSIEDSVAAHAMWFSVPTDLPHPIASNTLVLLDPSERELTMKHWGRDESFQAALIATPPADMLVVGYERKTYLEYVSTLNHELYHIKQAVALQQMGNETGLYPMPFEPIPRVTLISEADFSNDGDPSYANLPELRRRMEIGAVRNEHAMLDALSGSDEFDADEIAAERSGADARCELLRCDDGHEALAGPVYFIADRAGGPWGAPGPSMTLEQLDNWMYP